MSHYGNTYDSSPSAFKGQNNKMTGGFVTDGGPNSPLSPSAKAGRGGQSQTLTPVTIKQLLNATQTPDENFKVDGKEISLITIVGIITSVTETSTSLTFQIDDNTGRIDVRSWQDDEESEFMKIRKSALRDGVHVRVYGRLRSFMDQRSIVAFSAASMRPIEDYNECVYHKLEVIYAHLKNVKGLTSGAMTTTTTTTTSYGNDQMATDGAQTLSRLENEVYSIIKESCGTYEEGTAVVTIIQRLSNRSTETQIRKALETLTSVGLVFPTIDDEHFRTVE